MKYTSIALLTLAAVTSAKKDQVLRGGEKNVRRLALPGGPVDKVGPPPKEHKVEKALKGDGLDVKARSVNLDLLNRLSQSSIQYSSGRGYACRFDSTGLGGPDDPLADPLSNQYFDRVEDQSTLQGCQDLCTERADCIGVEYGHTNKRCELWKVEIGHMEERNSSWGCYRKFQGSEDALCRVSINDVVSGSHLDDSGETTKVANLDSIDECSKVCANDVSCTGFSYNDCANECDLWKKEIGVMLPVKGNTCLSRYTPVSSVTAIDPNAIEVSSAP